MSSHEKGGNILVFNAGSSSLKFGLFSANSGDDQSFPSLLVDGVAEEIGHREATFTFNGQKESGPLPDVKAAMNKAADALSSYSTTSIAAVAHRIVHGGPGLRQHVLANAETLQHLKQAVAFAPLHLPPALAIVDEASKRWPGAASMLCLDTAFHAHMPDVSQTLALPKDVRDGGIQRYGFHGLSLESILRQLSPVPGRLVVAHLGSGCSISAIQDGCSIDTSMGFTPNAGVLMGTRCGDIDPGAVTYLMTKGHQSPEQLDRLLNSQSGLLGVSGLSSDVRELLSARATNADADLALRMFCYQIRKEIAAMAAALGGIDLLVWTGGIGEHASELTSEVTRQLALLLSFETKVLPAQEDLQMARIAEGLLQGSTAS